MITNIMITTPRDTPGKITSRQLSQSHRNLAIDMPQCKGTCSQKVNKLRTAISV
jgi:hypothetical protein